MKKITLLTSLIFLFFLNHCSKEDKNIVDRIEVEEKTNYLDLNLKIMKSVYLEDEEMTVPHALFFDRNNKIIHACGYVQPEMNMIIKKFNTELNYVGAQRLSYGQGPGEVGTGANFFKFENKILVADSAQRRISVFDGDFQFLRIEKIVKPIFGFAFVGAGNRFLCREYKQNKKFIHFKIVSFPGFDEKKILSFGPYKERYDRDKRNRIVYGKFPEFDYFSKNGKIYFINLKNYTITMFDLQGETLKKIKVIHKSLNATDKEKKAWLKERFSKSAERMSAIMTFDDYIQPCSLMVPLGKGFVVIRRTDYSPYCKDFVQGDYFDYDLNLLGKVRFPCFLSIFSLYGRPLSTYMFADGFFYAISERDDMSNIEKWRVME